MARTFIDLPDDLKAELEAMAAADNLSWLQFCERALTESLTRPDPTPPAPLSPGVIEDQVADHLLAQLEPNQARLVQQIAHEKRVRPYHLFLSYCQTALARGEASEITMEATRRAQQAFDRPISVTPAEATCQYCGTTFTPKRIGQPYCPDPDDGEPGCGRKAMLADLHARRAGVEQRRDQMPPPQVSTERIVTMLTQRRQAGLTRTAEVAG